MTTIDTDIPIFSNPINRETQTPSEISIAGDTTISEFPTITNKINTVASQMNTVAIEVNDYKSDAETARDLSVASKDIALASANFKGNWSDQTGAANIPYSVYHDSRFWQLTSNLADVTAKEPGVDSEWVRSIVDVVNILGDLGGGTDDIDLNKGDVVTATISTATQTFTFSNPSTTGNNSSFVLFLTNGGSQTINFPASVDWIAATAPTLTAAGLDVLVFTTNDAGTTWYGFVAGLDVK